MTAYCGTACQLLDWKCGHKKECKILNLGYSAQVVKKSIQVVDAQFLRPAYLSELLNLHPLGLPGGLQLVFKMANTHKESKCPVIVQYEIRELKKEIMILNLDTPIYNYSTKRLRLSFSDNELQKIPNNAEYILNYLWLPPKDRSKQTKELIMFPYSMFKAVAHKYVLKHLPLE